MISQTAEYALRAIVLLARADAPLTTAQISQGARLPAHYLAKVMQSLCRAGLVQSQRGLGGGFTLASDAAELTVLDVVNAVDPIQRIRTCPLGLEAHGVHLCPLHRKLDDAVARVEETFQGTTIDDLLTSPRRRPTCRFPKLPRQQPINEGRRAGP